MTAKAPAIANIAIAVRSGGVVFGATILGQGVRHNAFGRRLMTTYNQRGIFGNETDDVEGLRAILDDSLDNVAIETVGVVALFAGRVT